MLALTMEDCLRLIDELNLKELASYSYSEASMLKLFVYALVKGIRAFKTLHDHMEQNRTYAVALKDGKLSV